MDVDCLVLDYRPHLPVPINLFSFLPPFLTLALPYSRSRFLAILLHVQLNINSPVSSRRDLRFPLLSPQPPVLKSLQHLESVDQIPRYLTSCTAFVKYQKHHQKKIHHEVACQPPSTRPSCGLCLCCSCHRATARALPARNLSVGAKFLVAVEAITDHINRPANQKIDGRFLALQNNTLGLYNGDDVSPVQVYTVDSEKAGCNELHTYPVGIVDHSIGLVGTPGLLDLVDMINPHTIEPGEGTVAQWDTFRLTDGKLANDEVGQWLAFPGPNDSWKVKWSDGSAVITADFMVVDVLYKSVGEGRYNGS
ncbi:hypothetical protein M426DRAFT_236256 [Hypoxylon sp. CI-4A]|nr:hypothetical protein M426DRAFT_236256 [Hypoxylon sp. CI-4A]